MKFCIHCEKKKTDSSFSKHIKAKDGLQSSCKACQKVTNRDYQFNNKEATVARVKRWQDNNRDKVNLESSKWRASKMNATPQWVNESYMKLWYKLAKMEEERTGCKVEVDHIIPLQNKEVCGLHCEHNMQLLFRRDNRSKGNTFII